MSETIKILWSFIKLIIKRWFLLIVFYGSLIGAIVTFRIFNIEVPSYVFWILTLIGLFWASFRVYKNLYIGHEELGKNHDELEKSHKELEKNHDELKKNHEQLKKKIPKKERELIFKPELSIMLLEGNEYTYSLSETASLREKTGDDYLTPDGSIELHLRIMNKGTVDLDIISIEPNYKDSEIPWSFYPFGSLKEKGKELFFPLHLDVKEVLLGDVTCKVKVHSTLNDAQFAARLVEIDKESKRILSRVDVEASTKGKLHTFSHSFEVFIRPLMDLYIKKWQEKNQEGLLRLSRSEDE